ncbi:unnamed protein product [Amoebophrya sp. A25]|nr:unnamed protein product [Amoebophrya sp. A25]|eukprot:GSA25T00011851001.1
MSTMSRGSGAAGVLQSIVASSCSSLGRVTGFSPPMRRSACASTRSRSGTRSFTTNFSSSSSSSTRRQTYERTRPASFFAPGASSGAAAFRACASGTSALTSGGSCAFLSVSRLCFGPTVRREFDLQRILQNDDVGRDAIGSGKTLHRDLTEMDCTSRAGVSPRARLKRYLRKTGSLPYRFLGLFLDRKKLAKNAAMRSGGIYSNPAFSSEEMHNMRRLGELGREADKLRFKGLERHMGRTGYEGASRFPKAHLLLRLFIGSDKLKSAASGRQWDLIRGSTEIRMIFLAIAWLLLFGGFIYCILIPTCFPADMGDFRELDAIAYVRWFSEDDVDVIGDGIILLQVNVIRMPSSRTKKLDDYNNYNCIKMQESSVLSLSLLISISISILPVYIFLL